MIITYNDDYAVFERLYNLVQKYDLKSDTKGVVPNREPGVDSMDTSKDSIKDGAWRLSSLLCECMNSMYVNNLCGNIYILW